MGRYYIWVGNDASSLDAILYPCTSFSLKKKSFKTIELFANFRVAAKLRPECYGNGE